MIENVLYGALFDAVEELGMAIIVVYLVAVVLFVLTCHFTVGKFFKLLQYFRLRITTGFLLAFMGLSFLAYMQALDPSVQKGLFEMEFHKVQWIPAGAYGMGKAFLEAMRPVHDQMQDVFSSTVLCLVYNFGIGLTFGVIGWIIFSILVGWKALILTLAGDLLINWKQGKWTKAGDAPSGEEPETQSVKASVAGDDKGAFG